MSLPKKQKLDGADWVSSDESSSPKTIQQDAMKEVFAIMGRNLVKGILSDFTIVAGEKGDELARKIPVHKFVLQGLSSVFEAMLTSGLTENSDDCVYIKDISYEVLLDMVHFLYTTEAPQFDSHPVELLLAADRYHLKKLKVWCAKKIAAEINLDNVVEAINAGSAVKSSHLYNRAKAFIMDPINKSTLRENGALRELHRDVAVDLFESSPSKPPAKE